MTQTPRLRARLRLAENEAARDAAIADWLQAVPEVAPARRVVLAEGVLFDREGPQGLPLVGLASGCPCCIGLTALRVKLGRTLRQLRPDAILLLTMRAGHLPRLRRLLESGELGVRFEVDGS